MSERQDAFQSEYLSRDHLVPYIWTDVATVTLAQAPDTDTALSVINARTIVIQLDTSSASNVSESVDLNVFASLDNGTTYDTIPWDSIQGIGTGEIVSFDVPTGPSHIKFTLDNNGASTAVVHADVLLRG